jgi:hypothetical protein
MAAAIELMPLTAWALSARLNWTPVQSAAGYRVYVRQSGQAFGAGIDVGLLMPTGGAVQYVVIGLPIGITNFFAVTAYDGLGRESALSNELSLLVTGSPTPTRTRTATASHTVTASPTPPATPPPSPVGSATATRTVTRTPTAVQPTATRTRTATATWTRTASAMQPSATRTASATVTRTPTPTASPASSAAKSLGLTAVGSILDTRDSNYLNGSRVLTSSGGQIASMSVHVGGVDAGSRYRKYQMAVYTDSGGRPGTLVAKTGTGRLVANAWNTLTISVSLQSNTPYWLMFNTNGRDAAVNNMRYNKGSVGQGAYSSSPVTFGTWPSNFPATTITDAVYSLYATFGP